MANKDLLLPLDRQHAEVLARFLSLVVINIQLYPEKYSFKAGEVKEVMDSLDYQIHEVKRWCVKKNCTYWIKKKRLEEIKSKAN